MDVGSVLLTMLTLTVGFALGEIAASRRRHADLKTRWDNDRRDLYATYLTHADTYHRILRDLWRIERRLDNPEGATADIVPKEINEEAFARVMRTMVETARNAREELWGRRKEVGDRLRESRQNWNLGNRSRTDCVRVTQPRCGRRRSVLFAARQGGASGAGRTEQIAYSRQGPSVVEGSLRLIRSQRNGRQGFISLASLVTLPYVEKVTWSQHPSKGAFHPSTAKTREGPRPSQQEAGLLGSCLVLGLGSWRKGRARTAQIQRSTSLPTRPVSSVCIWCSGLGHSCRTVEDDQSRRLGRLTIRSLCSSSGPCRAFRLLSTCPSPYWSGVTQTESGPAIVVESQGPSGDSTSMKSRRHVTPTRHTFAASERPQRRR